MANNQNSNKISIKYRKEDDEKFAEICEELHETKLERKKNQLAKLTRQLRVLNINIRSYGQLTNRIILTQK